MNSIFIPFFLPSATLSRPLPLPPTPPPHSTSLCRAFVVPSRQDFPPLKGVASQNGNNINIVRARSLKNEEAYSYEYQDIGDKSSRVEAWGWDPWPLWCCNRDEPIMGVFVAWACVVL
ncbi:hypothetical protein Fmac_001249 [Flemingia macrophylla]|uniref:Uncharacterized protein n=1 Tax=Flemingia macrophylla TaxID=520843 RepID=A0ABD1NGJ9_9FABA